MRDDEIRRRLREVNPWWTAIAAGEDPTAWTAHDHVLRDRSRWDLGYRSTVLDDISSGEVDDRLVVLRGPRRVGKSVILKDTAASLCGLAGFNPLRIVYLPLDGMRKADLNRVATLGRELTRSVGEVPRVWLLDEVTGVRGWTEAIKYLRDNTDFGNDTVVCTGSSWDDEADVERDLQAGRSGAASTKRTRLALPMSFREYAAATGRRLPEIPHVGPWDLQGDAAGDAAITAELYVDELDLAWQAYLTSGGFPRAVAEHHRTGAVSDPFLADLGAWLHRDVDPDAAADSVALLLAELAERSTSPLNRTDTAQALGYGNTQTFDLRINRLVRSFGALWCHQINSDDGSRIAGAQSKLYLSDPLLSWLPALTRGGQADPDYTHLSEGALAVAVARAVDAIEPGRWISNDSIGYVRTGSGNEIDLGPVPLRVAGTTVMTTPLESKWVSTGWRKEALTVEGKYHRGVLATKNIIDTTNLAWALPAPLVALLIG